MLLSGAALDPKKYFSVGSPPAQATTFNLTVGKIFDHDGKEHGGIYTLHPGEMVQVISSEVFSLSDNVTGHVTYKTSLTRIGIWALTVGIVDPGWTGPVATTLFNFSKVDFAVQAGQEFLRVSLFKHDPVTKPVPKVVTTKYYNEIQKFAATTFPRTFLNKDEVVRSAAETVLEMVQNRATTWIASITFLFLLIQIVTNYIPPLQFVHQDDPVRAELYKLDVQLRSLRAQVDKLQSTPAQPEATPSP